MGRSGASLAAYAARASLSCTVLVPEPELLGDPDAEIAAEIALTHGARVIVVSAEPEAVVATSPRVGRALGILFVNADDPIRLEAEKTLASELLEQSADASPTVVFLPDGVGLGAASLRRGFDERHGDDLVGERTAPEVVTVPVRSINRRDVESARGLLAEEEGLLVSWASAAAFAQLVRDVRAGRVGPDGHAVVVVEAPIGGASLPQTGVTAAVVRTKLRGLRQTLADPAPWVGRQAPGRSW